MKNRNTISAITLSLTIAICMIPGIQLCAQMQSDSLKRTIAHYTNRNFSELRTINLQWDVMSAYDYTLKQDGKEIEKGEMETLRHVNFQTTIPVFRSRKFSIYGNGTINYYHFKATVSDDTPSPVFMEVKNEHLYMKGGITFNYYNSIAGKPLLLSASAGIDGWEKGMEQVHVSIMGNMILKQSEKNNISVGLYAMYPYQITPVVPLIIWTHHFNSSWTLDFTLPSRLYVRYQKGKHRFSVGTQMETEQFYMDAPARYKNAGEEGISTYYYSKNMIKPELVYECILNKRFYLIARGGGACSIGGGMYDTNRKGMDNKPLVEISHSMIPFFNVGFSYSLFK